jgi:hypothetical protein
MWSVLMGLFEMLGKLLPSLCLHSNLFPETRKHARMVLGAAQACPGTLFGAIPCGVTTVRASRDAAKANGTARPPIFRLIFHRRGKMATSGRGSDAFQNRLTRSVAEMASSRSHGGTYGYWKQPGSSSGARHWATGPPASALTRPFGNQEARLSTMDPVGCRQQADS